MEQIFNYLWKPVAATVAATVAVKSAEEIVKFSKKNLGDKFISSSGINVEKIDKLNKMAMNKIIDDFFHIKISDSNDDQAIIIINSKPKREDFVIQGKNHKTSKGENLCREILEEIFPGKKFPPVKCKVIKFPNSKRSIEIDCFNYEAGIALEFQGIQHYQFSLHFHKEYSDFEKQQSRDKFKKINLEKYFIFISVPHTCKNKEQLKEYILNSIPEKRRPRPSASFCNIL